MGGGEEAWSRCVRARGRGLRMVLRGVSLGVWRLGCEAGGACVREGARCGGGAGVGSGATWSRQGAVCGLA